MQLKPQPRGELRPQPERLGGEARRSVEQERRLRRDAVAARLPPRLLDQGLLLAKAEALAHAGEDVLEGGGGRPVEEGPPEEVGEGAAEQRRVDLAQVDGGVEEAREAALAVEPHEGHRGDAHL